MIENSMSIPPVFAASALYDNLLQAALRQFFSRATFETEPIPSLSSDGRLAIEPTNDPSVLTIRWFGSRHVLHVPGKRPFTAHEVRLARAIGAVLAARYRAIFDPKQMLERGELFRGAIEDRDIAAFLDASASNDPSLTRADLIATAIEVLRVAALSSYEDRSISSGVLILEGEDDPVHPRGWAHDHLYRYSETDGDQELLPLSDGMETVFLVNRNGDVLDIVEVTQYADPATLTVPCATAYRSHALATAGNANLCVVLSPSHEIKVFAEGVQTFSFRNARWHLLDIQAKYEMWDQTIENPALSQRLFQTAVDLADSREGALFVVLRDPAASLSQLVARSRPARPGTAHRRPRADARAAPAHASWTHRPRARSRRAGRPGAHRRRHRHRSIGRLLAVGAILLHTEPPEPHSSLAVEGARTTAAMAPGGSAPC